MRRLLITANVPSSPILGTLMMEALSSSETSVLTKSIHGVTSQKTPFFINKCSRHISFIIQITIKPFIPMTDFVSKLDLTSIFCSPISPTQSLSPVLLCPLPFTLQMTFPRMGRKTRGKETTRKTET
jgi:hypothetical protein